MKKKHLQQPNNFKLLIALLITIGLVGAAVYFVNHQKQLNTQNKSTTPAQSSVNDQKTINCAKKIDQDGDKSLISQAPGESNCLYLGCGGFFQ